MISDLAWPPLTLGIETDDQVAQEPLLLLRVPVGLLHRAASMADRAEGAAGRVGAELVRLGIRMFVDFAGLEIEKFFVADVLEHQRLSPIADDDPIALAES